jgi:hypothetical protein
MEVLELLKYVKVDPAEGAYLWNQEAIAAALTQLEQINKTKKAYLVVRRGRELEQKRTETQGIISGGEDALAPKDCVTLFMFRLKRHGSKVESSWPQLRFPDGGYVFAFALG